MPTPYVKKIADDQGKPTKELEAVWDKAKKAAGDEGHGEDYAYITGIFKRMAGVTASALPQGHATRASARLAVTASSDAVRKLARSVFGQDCMFEPHNEVDIDSKGEATLMIIPVTKATDLELEHFDKVLDRHTQTYKVSYVLPDPSHGPRSIKVTFFKGYRPMR